MKNNDVARPNKKYFVYTLARPDGSVFYVGKGSRDRAREHITEAKRDYCFCRKCRIIRAVWSKRGEVKIEYVFSTDDGQEALAQERDLIYALARTNDLCNQSHNKNEPWIGKLAEEMTLDEYRGFLESLGRSAEQKRAAVRNWAGGKLAELRKQLRKAKQYHWDDEIPALEQAIYELKYIPERTDQKSFID